jgi:hypothetical protein
MKKSTQCRANLKDACLAQQAVISVSSTLAHAPVAEPISNFRQIAVFAHSTKVMASTQQPILIHVSCAQSRTASGALLI